MDNAQLLSLPTLYVESIKSTVARDLFRLRSRPHVFPMDWFGIVKETAQKVVEICKEDLIEISNTIPVLDAYADQAELYLEQSFNGLLYSFKKLDKNQQELYDISNSLRQPSALTEKQIAFNASFDPIAVAGIQANILSEIPQIKSVYHELGCY